MISFIGKIIDSILMHEDHYNYIPEHFNSDTISCQMLNSAFLILLCGKNHPHFENAQKLIAHAKLNSEYGQLAEFYMFARDKIKNELSSIFNADQNFKDEIKRLGNRLKENALTDKEFREHMWKVFFPEGAGIYGQELIREKKLCQKRKIEIETLNPDPLTDPGTQILFTSNVLLSLPPRSRSIDELPVDDFLKNKLVEISKEKQKYWFDHPIQIGVSQENNEILYGLKALNTAIEFEKNRGNFPETNKVACVLSVSVTHEGLHEIAGYYLKNALEKFGSLPHLDIYMFSERDTQYILDEVLIPVGEKAGLSDLENLSQVFGVDGEYGRHYSFLKAVAAFWQVFKDPKVKATFKIDLDQVFPQQNLVEETGLSAFEHFKTSLWGAEGKDVYGNSLELGMIAGALVNDADIDKSLFTPDVDYPDEKMAGDKFIFFSRLPQALSTRAEMMTRYDSDQLDGKKNCIHRIHVTGGTNGILISALRKYRPFTPTFIGRAEDQAYILSTFSHTGPELAYAHQPGLIMRHDKETFIGEAIKSAKMGKLIGDYIRILIFSSYARDCFDINIVKKYIDPFTGCFVSKIPQTIVFLRFSLTAARMIHSGNQRETEQFIKEGASRIAHTLEFVEGENSGLNQRFKEEQRGWNVFYDILDRIEEEKELCAEYRTRVDNIIAKTKI